MEHIVNLLVELSENSDTIPLFDDHFKYMELRKLTQTAIETSDFATWYKAVQNLEVIDRDCPTWKAIGVIIGLKVDVYSK